MQDADLTHIKVLVFPVSAEPYEHSIPNTLEAMQKLVNGRIECVPIDGFDITINEEGKYDGSMPNRWLTNKEGRVVDYVAGQFFVSGDPDSEGNTTSIMNEQIEKALAYFKDQEISLSKVLGNPLMFQ